MLADDVRSLLRATAESADETVSAARQRLNDVLEQGKESWERLGEGTARGAHAVDDTVHAHPWTTAAVTLAVGVLVGYLCARSD